MTKDLSHVEHKVMHFDALCSKHILVSVCLCMLGPNLHVRQQMLCCVSYHSARRMSSMPCKHWPLSISDFLRQIIILRTCNIEGFDLLCFLHVGKHSVQSLKLGVIVVKLNSLRKSVGTWPQITIVSTMSIVPVRPEVSSPLGTAVYWIETGWFSGAVKRRFIEFQIKRLSVC